MKLITFSAIFYILILNSFSQDPSGNESNDTVPYINMLDYGETIEHYNYSDTLNDSFASFYIKSSFESLEIVLKELKEDSLTHIVNGETYLFISPTPTWPKKTRHWASCSKARLFISWVAILKPRK